MWSVMCWPSTWKNCWPILKFRMLALGSRRSPHPLSWCGGLLHRDTRCCTGWFGKVSRSSRPQDIALTSYDGIDIQAHPFIVSNRYLIFKIRIRADGIKTQFSADLCITRLSHQCLHDLFLIRYCMTGFIQQFCRSALGERENEFGFPSHGGEDGERDEERRRLRLRRRKSEIQFWSALKGWLTARCMPWSNITGSGSPIKRAGKR